MAKKMTERSALKKSIKLWKLVAISKTGDSSYVSSKHDISAVLFGCGQMLNACPLCEYADQQREIAGEPDIDDNRCTYCPVWPADKVGETTGCEGYNSPYEKWRDFNYGHSAEAERMSEDDRCRNARRAAQEVVKLFEDTLDKLSEKTQDS